VPVLCRQRTVGVITACALTRDFLDQETLARFCSRHELDLTLLSRLAVGVRIHQNEDLRAFGEILSRQAEALTSEALARRDIEDLSSQLAQAYEQFHVLYRASADMTLSRKPVLLFERICQELLGATVVESFAAVLLPAGDAPSPPTVVVAGPLDVPRADLVRLYEQARSLPPSVGPAVVLNDLTSRPELTWADAWLSQLVLFPLSRNDRAFGGIMAINRRDGLGFGSEEIQFINAMAERSSAFLENVRLYDDLEQLFMGMLHALVSSIDAKDPYTCGHSQRVAWLSRHIAGLAGIAEAESQRVYLSGLLHDIGKIGVSEAVLRKTGLLTPDEYEEMKRHPEIGANILQGVRQVDDVIPGVLHHHDRFDGKGYPFSLRGEEIPLLGRIVALADSFDAITSNRTYREAQSIAAATTEIRRCSGTQFDPILADLFVQQDLDEISAKMARSGRSASELE
jgi:HD-GYP domain-containing protein (c-di-GMP phosphodiesterase class II)